MKRILFLLCVLLSLQLAQGASTLIDGLYYDLDSSSKTALVTYKSSNSSGNSTYVTGELVIPEKVAYEGITYSVTSIGYYAFEDCSGLTSVVIPNSVTSIGYYAFSGCSGLTSVVIPNSVTLIGDYAFYGCSGLTSVEIPNSVTSIGDYSFLYCSGLTSVKIPNSVISIGEGAFSFCNGLTSVEIPNSVTSIGDYAFYECSGLTSVTIGNSVTSIGDYAFCYCSGVTSVTIGNSVTSIGEGAFEYCSGLTSVEIPNSVTSIGKSAFYGCSGLKSVEISDLTAWCNIQFYSDTSNPLYYAGHLYLNGTEIKDLVIPNSVTEIGNYAFEYCHNLTSVEIPNSVTKIGDHAFYGCSGLKSVEISDLTAWCNIQFYSDTSNPLYYAGHLYLNGTEIKDLVIPNSVTEIGNYAFEYCHNLTSVEIPNSVTSIGDQAFYSCLLKTIKLLASTPPDYFNAFNSYINSAVLYIPSNTYDVYMATDWRFFATIIEGSELKTGTFTVDGITYRYKDDEAAVISCEKTVTIVKIPERLTADTDFGRETFTVTGIEKIAFSECSQLQSVSIPASCLTVGDYAFSNCTGLALVTCVGITPPVCAPTAFSGTACPILVVKEAAVSAYQTANIWKDFNFILGLEGTGAKVGIANISRLSYLYINNEASVISSSSYSSMTSVEIPDEITVSDASGATLTCKVTSIMANAFKGCNSLNDLTIPSSIVSIGKNAFGNCSNLTTVNSFALEPPVCESNSFAYAPCNYLHVLPQARNAYQTAPVWKEFGSIIGDLNLFEYNKMKFVLNETDNTAELVMVDESVTVANIPSSVTKDGQGYSVTSIAEGAFEGCDNLSSITIPGSVSVMYGNCFKGLNSLKTIAFTDGESPMYIIGEIQAPKLEILTIGRELYKGKTQINGEDVECNPSFANIATLTSLNFGKNIKTIVKGMFSGCANLRSITIPGNIEFIGDEAFANCTSLKSINLEDSESPVTIESATAGGGTGTTFGAPIETIYLGRNVEYVGTELSPFKNMETLTTLTIGNKTTSINDYLFYGCRNIEMMSVPASVTYIGGYSFYDCSTAKLLTISRSVETIGEYAFYNCRGLSTLTIPSSVVRIGDYAFRSCSGLTSISIGDGVKTIGNYAFLDCYMASNITIGNSVQTIGENAFYNCQSWSSIVIPNSVVTISANAFALCQGANEITIGSGVQSIGERAFADCDYITQVKCLGSTPPSAYDNTFTTYEAILYVPENAISSYKSSACWKNFKTIVNDSSSEIPATGITITPSAPVELKAGDSLQLTATVSPENATDKSVTWESSNSSVASVSQQGLVTAVSPGTAVITASDAYGHNAIVAVTVKADDTPVEIPATGIIITPSGPSELKMGESLQLTATVSPENATDKSVTWESSDSSVASVNQQGLVTAVSPGTAVITASDAYGHNAFAIITVISSEQSGMETLVPDAEKLYILTINGILIKGNATQEDINALAPGIYIIGGRKVIIR